MWVLGVELRFSGLCGKLLTNRTNPTAHCTSLESSLTHQSLGLPYIFIGNNNYPPHGAVYDSNSELFLCLVATIVSCLDLSCYHLWWTPWLTWTSTASCPTWPCDNAFASLISLFHLHYGRIHIFTGVETALPLFNVFHFSCMDAWLNCTSCLPYKGVWPHDRVLASDV